MNENLLKCDYCGLMIIFEELETHVCRDVENYKIEGKILWVFDGIRWIPRKLSSITSDGTLQQDKSKGNDDNFTEPS